MSTDGATNDFGNSIRTVTIIHVIMSPAITPRTKPFNDGPADFSILASTSIVIAQNTILIIKAVISCRFILSSLSITFTYLRNITKSAASSGISKITVPSVTVYFTFPFLTLITDETSNCSFAFTFKLSIFPPVRGIGAKATCDSKLSTTRQRVADALLDYMLALPGNEQVRSINPLVAETNDGWLNDIRGRHAGRREVFAAIREAREGPVEEGAVGAGTGTVAFGWKGGIGTSSRKAGQWTVGVLVQTNYGGDLHILGVPVGRLLRASGRESKDGSVIVVIATDAPVDARNLKRMAARSALGLGRTGAAGSNGSGDYAIAFSTVRRPEQLLPNDAMSPLFEAVIEATEEAVYNSLFRARTMEGNGRRVEALPVQRVLEILRDRKAIP